MGSDPSSWASIRTRPHEAETGATDRDRTRPGLGRPIGIGIGIGASDESGAATSEEEAEDGTAARQRRARKKPKTNCGQVGNRLKRGRGELAAMVTGKSALIVFPEGQRPQHIVTRTCENMQETP
jgi:hypothetical protein